MVESLNSSTLNKEMGRDDASTPLNNNIKLNILHKKLKIFQSTVLHDVEKRLSDITEDIMQEIHQHELQAQEFKNFAPAAHQQHESEHNTWSNRKVVSSTDAHDGSTALKVAQKYIEDNANLGSAQNQDQLKGKRKQEKRSLPDKIFVTRQSYLTALLEVDHMKSIYHVFYTIFLMFMLNSVCFDYFVEGRINFGLGTFKTGLAKIHYVLCIWLMQHLFMFLLYFAFKGWACVRAKLAGQSWLQRFWSHSCLIVFISAQLVFGYVPSTLCLKLDLPFVTASVLLLETARMLMKMHAFVRTNAPRVIQGKLKAENDESPEKAPKSTVVVPPFNCYLYFLFAPTLIYRDNYPRTTKIRLKFTLSRLMEVVAIAFLYSYIFERYIRTNYANYGLEEMDAAKLIVKIFGMMLPSIVIFLCGFYLILHAWLNFTAELLYFGDRMFYKDWWTASTYDAYYRNWNVVVHDWLYEYIYKDVYNNVFKNSKLCASLTVFMISALVHEHILGFALQIFFPVMIFFFGVLGVALVYITRRLPKPFGNMLLWFTLILGNGMMVSLYCMEYYASSNCPKVYNKWTDYLIPAIWSCYNR